MRLAADTESATLRVHRVPRYGLKRASLQADTCHRTANRDLANIHPGETQSKFELRWRDLNFFTGSQAVLQIQCGNLIAERF